MKIGILREGKTPPDARVALSPSQAAYLRKEEKLNVVVQRSSIRCFDDSEYERAGVPLVDSVEDCDILIGVKEVPIDALIPEKTYFFFSHTIKKQPYNQPLIAAVLQKNIRLIDYEVLTNDNGQRLIAFGFFAGMVGAYNGILGYGKQTGRYELKRLGNFIDYADACRQFETLQLPQMKIVLTGTGRVGMGAVKVLKEMGIQQVDPFDFLQADDLDFPVFTQLSPADYATRKDGQPFDINSFYNQPQIYQSAFRPFAKKADIFINGIYWDNKAPVFFSVEDMQHPDFNIRFIADITCDIAPVASIPATLRASTISEPFFGFNPVTNEEVEAFTGGVDMMTIDNLPSELPRDASQSFGEQFIENILPCLTEGFQHPVIRKATITENGSLGPNFKYLEDYAFS